MIKAIIVIVGLDVAGNAGVAVVVAAAIVVVDYGDVIAAVVVASVVVLILSYILAKPQRRDRSPSVVVVVGLNFDVIAVVAADGLAARWVCTKSRQAVHSLPTDRPDGPIRRTDQTDRSDRPTRRTDQTDRPTDQLLRLPSPT